MYQRSGILHIDLSNPINDQGTFVTLKFVRATFVHETNWAGGITLEIFGPKIFYSQPKIFVDQNLF